MRDPIRRGLVRGPSEVRNLTDSVKAIKLFPLAEWKRYLEFTAMTEFGGPLPENLEVGLGFWDADGLADWLLKESPPRPNYLRHGLELKEDHGFGLGSDLWSVDGLPPSSSDGQSTTAFSTQTPSITDGDSEKNGAVDTSSKTAPPGNDITSREDNDSQSKRMLRLVKNRQAAFLSRQRKKSYLKDLELKCSMWESCCNRLQQALAFSCAENEVLREELSRCKMQKGGDGATVPAVLKDSLQSESPSQLTTLAVVFLAFGGHYLGWSLAKLILLVLGGTATQPSGAYRTEERSRGFRGLFVYIRLKFQLFPIIRGRSFSSLRRVK